MENNGSEAFIDNINLEIPAEYDEKSFVEFRKIAKDGKMKEYIIKYSLENCINNGFKIDLSTTEKECLVNRAFTFKTTVDNFTSNQNENFNFTFKL